MSKGTAPQARKPGPPYEWPELTDFSLVLGGPLYQLLRKTRLEDRVEDYLLRRVVVICGVIWLPLCVLCLIDGTLLGGVAVPFLADAETHARFLVAVPLLIVAELLVHQRIRGIVRQFLERGLVPAASLDRFRAALQSAMRLRNSVAAEVLLIAVIAPLGFYARTRYIGLDTATWYARFDGGASTMTPAGIWFWAVSNPLFQLLIFRWYFRLFIWARFLWQVARIGLALVPTHPDRNGGLGFLGQAAHAMTPLLTAHGAAVAGYAANRIFHDGASLAAFKLEAVLLVTFMAMLLIGPFFVFMPQLLAARRSGLRDYGIVAAEYTRAFHRRWVSGEERDAQPLLGSADIQSLADMANAFAVVKEMRPLPVGRDTFMQLVVATLIPFVPLLFTMFPLEELLNRVIGAIF